VRSPRQQQVSDGSRNYSGSIIFPPWIGDLYLLIYICCAQTHHPVFFRPSTENINFPRSMRRKDLGYRSLNAYPFIVIKGHRKCELWHGFILRVGDAHMMVSSDCEYDLAFITNNPVPTACTKCTRKEPINAPQLDDNVRCFWCGGKLRALDLRHTRMDRQANERGISSAERES
jgi:hypothetical protein